MKNIFISIVCIFALIQSHAQKSPRDTLEIVWEAESYSINKISFSPDSKYIATGDNGSFVKIWNVDSAKQVNVLTERDMPVFSHNNQYLACIKVLENDIYIYHFPSLELYKKIPTMKGFGGHICDIVQMQFSPNDSSITTAQQDSGLFIWDIETGQRIKNIKDFPFVPDPKFGGVPTVRGFDYTPDGSKIIFFGQRCFLYDLQNDTIIKEFGGLNPLVSPDGTKLLTMAWMKQNDFNYLMYFDINTGNLIKRIDTTNPTDFAFSYDGNYIISMGDGRFISFTKDDDSSKQIEYQFYPARGCVYLTVSPDGKYIATSAAYTLLLFNYPFYQTSVPDETPQDNKSSIIKYYPNPSDNLLNIIFTTKKACIVKLSLLNELGIIIQELVNYYHDFGEYEEIFDLSTLSNGIYLLKLEQEVNIDIKKIIIVK
ncbi:MAG: T9SS type A sorting domain-containing protein [Bacteroidetes bacterium]|nr:T9SS type A sorting domain-containing protein [Bacteroidota bacterium]